MGVWFAADVCREWRWPTALVMGGVVSLLGCLALTVRQVAYWHDSGMLFTRALSVTTNNFLAYNNLGAHLGEQGKVEEEISVIANRSQSSRTSWNHSTTWPRLWRPGAALRRRCLFTRKLCSRHPGVRRCN